MRTPPVRALALFLSSVTWPVGAVAQSGESVNLEAIRSTKRVSAVRIAEAIRLDGILDDPVWQGIAPATDFYQQQPAEFSAATRRTEVRFAYDDDTLYLGAMMFDDEPDQLITNDLSAISMAAMATCSASSSIRSRTSATRYGFLTNPGGAQRETQAYDNGRRNDANWHGVWFVRTAVLENGGALEFAIPFKTLRFPARADQEWGLNVVRIVRRINERSTWSPVPRQFSHYNVAYAGTLDGVRGVQPGRNFWIKPFATSDIEHRGALGSDWDRPAPTAASISSGASRHSSCWTGHGAPTSRRSRPMRSRSTSPASRPSSRRNASSSSRVRPASRSASSNPTAMTSGATWCRSSAAVSASPAPANRFRSSAAFA